MEVEDSQIVQYKPFWTLTPGSVISREGDAALADRVRVTLSDSIDRQMVADVPVGIFLSGGVDSSGIVALASQRTSVPLTTYSVGFQGAPDYDELAYARTIARQFKTNHVERIVERNEIAEFIPKIVDIYDEPLADATSIPIYFISELARRNGTVAVLTGDGADELFCGYRRWASYARVLPWYRGLLKTPQWARGLVKAGYAAMDSSSPKFEFLSQLAAGHEVYWGAGGFKASVVSSLLSPEYLDRIGGREPYEEIRAIRRNYIDAFGPSAKSRDINWLCYWGFVEAVPNLYCYRADRMGMAHSIEIRVPFLDNKVVDLAFSLPDHAKLKDGVSKAVLKTALEPFLPKEILYRRKMGFCVPIREWAGDVFVGYVENHLKSFCKDTGLFREEGVRNLIKASKSGNTDYAFGLWNLYFLMAWMNKWILMKSR
jgi:asparagine synthase (glutamine-hydrolysing)